MAAVRSFDRQDRSSATGTVRSRGAISPAATQRNRPWSFPGRYGSTSVMDGMLRSDTLRRRARRTSEGNVVEDLIDFFRNTPPPPGNFVSTPDPLDEKPKENKRFAFWPFRRKANVAGKEARAAPRRIKLPDSAVAGTTVDGYRHIAISIPIEYAHLELLTDNTAVPGAEHAKAGQVEDESKVPSFVKADYSSRTEQDHRKAEPSALRTGDTVVDAGTPAAPSELSPRQNTRRSGSTVAMMKDGPEKKRALHHQPVIGRWLANSEDLQGIWACQSGNSHLLGKRPSSPESVSSTSSEPINSEAETVYIPSPSSGAGLPNSSRSNNSDEETASYHTPALSPSSPGFPPREAPDIWGESENWSALSDLSAPYGRGTFQTSSSAHGASFSHHVMYRDHQPHTLSDIPSETQTLQSFHLAPTPVTVVADIEPSTQTPSRHIGPGTNDEASSADTSSQPRTPVLVERRRPRRVRGISDLRVLAPSPDPSPCASQAGHPSPVSQSPPRSASRGDHIRRYDDGRQRARQREFDLLLLDRLERLEQAFERWTSALVPLLGRRAGFAACRILAVLPCPV
ncbi:uncharacterized protein THITE_2111685 [Thermothielavioides terrestris NRRL 8126]|uniref:Uncharacterized protein n=1 Tax=Thermothielavioides terrestris (strain ATCC 38088 / NRRL 8126) TaxID=578455 RepID=G2R375_THETT|nr:uncharacterized protein THITE_2111685 [Thermothielavioides terrestris NRRL 8126]AEO65081.1 hypothetical protein THITE_2111685 [Thermothielavioides terrestris NRRL 8126]